MTKRLWGRLLALALAGWLLAAPALAAETEPVEFDMDGPLVTIATVEEFLAFGKFCALDTWSQGKTVELAADLDLSEVEFAPIPTFGGVFLGGEHTISGLSVTGAGSAQGLFRYIQPGGVVQDLTVEGTVAPAGTRSIVGGIVGDNSGALQNCAFRGTVQGDSMVGGIAGRNNAGGQIIECSMSGSVGGGSSVGGIAGRSTGLLMTCENNASVNVTQAESGPALTGPDAEAALEELAGGGSYNLLVGSSDTGGIVGWSDGDVQGCVNNGAVGYPHVGYNVGGIAGRQSGSLWECVNNGAVNGRKDVGGIVGQGEPYLIIEPREDTVERLRRELDALDQLIDKAITDAQGASGDISARLSAMGGFTDTALANSRQLLDQLSSFADANVSAANTLASRLSGALNKMSPGLDDLLDAGGRLEELAVQLGEAMDALNGDGQPSDGLEAAVERLREAGEELAGAADGVKNAQDQLLSGDPDQQQAALDGLKDSVSQMEGASGGVSAAAEALDEFRTSLGGSGSLSETLGGLLDQLRDASDSAAGIGTLLRQSADAISGAVSDLTSQGSVQFTALGGQFRQSGTGLINALGGLSSEMERLNSSAKAGTDALIEDLRLINSQFRMVVEVMMDAMEDMGQSPEDRLDEFIQDTSEEDAAATREGKVASCQNTGTVDGDRNVGGVIGAMGMEFDLDPEDDAASYLSFGAAYETKAVLQGCVNYGGVTAKKDCAGGLVGRMDLGTALDCEGYGPVESTGGNYVGGIAGWADASVRSCWSKSTLSGGNYVGGVAGLARSLRDCRAIATVAQGSECVGAIAGNIQEDGVLSGNCFVDTGVAGVDGVSYVGRAEPVSFDAMSVLEGVPEAFTAFTVTLRADGKVVAQVPFLYGDDLSLLELPPVPQRAGCYGVWPELDTASGSADVTLDALYSPWIDLLASEERSDKLSLALAEGQFTNKAVLQVEDITEDLAKKEDDASVTWNVVITGSGLGAEDEVPLRLLSPKGGDADVWQYVDGDWARVDAERNGRYLMLTMKGPQGTFFLQPKSAGAVIAPMIVAAAGVVIILLAAGRLLWNKRGKKGRRQPPGGPSPLKKS